MQIDILTLFPKMFDGPFDESIIARAKQKGLIKINVHDLRKWGQGERKTVDDRPYGGGVGMVLMIEPIYKALSEIKGKGNIKTILLSANGAAFTQRKAEGFSKLDQLILIAGHYEGVDNRVAEHLVDEEISIGNYVLTGGELPAMVMADTIARLIPGVIPKEEAIANESFSHNMELEYPHYTRPEEFMGFTVPKVLLSGDHKKIEEWKKEQSEKKSRDNKALTV